MAIAMKENGNETRLMGDMECIIMQMGLAMRASGATTRNRAKAWRSDLMGAYTEESIMKGGSMGSARSLGLMELLIVESGS